MVLYLNGTAIATTTFTSNLNVSSSTNTCKIGETGAIGLRKFNGVIDEVKIWNNLRTATDIQNDMAESCATYPINLIAYYKLNETSGTAITAAQGLSGTLTGTLTSVAGATLYNGLGTNTIMYVDSSNVSSCGRDGKTWATAFGSLSDALDAAHNNPLIQKVYVAKGTYKPTRKPYNMDINKKGVEMTTSFARDVTFHMRAGIDLQGGFPMGGGTQNITVNKTILSGDIGVVANTTDNAYHVILADSSANWATTGSIAKINGFTIRDGNANAGNTITVNGRTISANDGSGVRLSYGTSVVSNCIFISNNIAILSLNTSNATIKDNTLSNNTGIGIVGIAGSISILNNLIIANTGGGISLTNGTHRIQNNSILNNISTSNGGGIFLSTTTSTIVNNLFSGNQAAAGGAIYINYGTNTISNNTIYGNIGTGNAGGIYTYFGTNSISNTIFWGNKKGTSTSVASADYYSNSGVNTFKNCLMQLPVSNYTYTTSGTYHLGLAPGNNLTGNDPLFINTANIVGADGICGTNDDGLRLKSFSPVLDKGSNALIPSGVTTDITGANRIQNTTVDMGAY